MIPDPVRIYHITPIEDLSSIISCGGLHSSHKLEALRLKPRSIAYANIQSRRDTWPVPCGSQGTVHDYVPWMFGTRSPMLYAISQGKVPDVVGQGNIVYLVSNVEQVCEYQFSFVFTNGHATMALTNYYEDLIDLNKVNWPLMKSRDWFNTPQNPDRKRQRQAEFLVHDWFPWELVKGIGVIDNYRLELVNSLLRESEHKPIARIMRNWYY